MTIAPLSLDGRRFAMASSTASVVNPESPSTFLYHEKDGIIWGDYEGDTVTFGRFVGTRVRDTLTVSFAHFVISSQTVVTGTSTSEVVTGQDGITTLVENFVIGNAGHVSVCVEIA